MIKHYKSFGDGLVPISHLEVGCWVNCTNPSPHEIGMLVDIYGIPERFITSSLDELERSRVELRDGKILVVVDVPIYDTLGDSKIFTTYPLGIILMPECIVTICSKKLPLIDDFILEKLDDFQTDRKWDFLLAILMNNTTYYLQYLKQINRMSDAIETNLQGSMKNKELIQLLNLEKSLVYISTSLIGVESVLEKIIKLNLVDRSSPEYTLLEEVMIENRQVQEMADIYSGILGGMMDAFASIISNNLNIVMKFMAAVTILLTIPTMIYSFFGMNVPFPAATHNLAFVGILVFSFSVSIILAIILIKRKMF